MCVNLSLVPKQQEGQHISNISQYDALHLYTTANYSHKNKQNLK